MKKKITTYLNGAEARLKNKRISFIEKNNNISIIFENVDTHAEEAACLHECIKGKIRKTSIKISKEGFEAMLGAYLEYKKYQIKMNADKINNKEIM